jgi:hypothetical protein
MKLYGEDGTELMRIESLERRDGQLLVRGKVFGAMPITASLRPEEARSGLRLLNARLAVFLLTFPFRRRSR